MSPILLILFVCLDAVEGVSSSCKSNLIRCCQCMAAAIRLFVSLWVVVFGSRRAFPLLLDSGSPYLDKISGYLTFLEELSD